MGRRFWLVTEGAWASTRVQAEGEGRYTASIGPQWVLVMAPQGGVVAALAARAMAAELGAETTVAQSLRSIHGVFARPVPAGPVVVDVEVLRRGRSMSQVQATVRGPDASAGYTALAVFGATRDGFAFTELAYPDVPAPEDCPSFRDPPPPESGLEAVELMSFWRDALEGRPALGHAPWDPSPRDAAEVATWYRIEDEPVEADGCLDPLTSLVMVDIMPSAVFEKVGSTADRWFGPSADLTVHLFGRATPGWLLAHNRAHQAGDGYASVEMALWDPRAVGGPELVAWATQQMFFTPWS